ncbi:peptidase [Bordetella genomosp. 9]|nr:peptidase [Bordetella genomosp. 9]
MEPGMEDRDARAACTRAAIEATQAWLVRAVIGLNLCPFAKSVHVKGQIRYAVSHAADEAGVAADLESELRRLVESDPVSVDTTMLILTSALQDFGAYNDFLAQGDRMLKRMRLRGVVQIASFHPDYRFADAGPDDIENYTNRSPYPILHLLREDSVARAIDSYPDPDDIYARNQETLRRLGYEGWRRVMRGEGR